MVIPMILKMRQMKVLVYYSTIRGVRVDDFSENKLKMKPEQLDTSNFFAEAFWDKIEELSKRCNTQNKQSNGLIHDIASIYAQFTDILPIKTIPPGDDNTRYGARSFVFIGDETAPSPIDQLAMALLRIVEDGVICQAKRGASLF